MNTKGAKTRDRIDLGLGAILAGVEASKEIEISLELAAPQSESASSPWTLGNEQSPPKSEFDLLADERRWTEITRRVESRLENKSDIEARLWWVRGHLGAFSMPVSFLAAPLESLCRDIQGTQLTPELTALLKETALLTLGRLEDVGEKGLAVELRRVVESVGIRQTRGAGGRQRVGTSSFRSLESQSPISETKAMRSIESTTTDSPPKLGRHRWVWTSVCVVVVAVLLYLDHLFPHLRSPTQGVASESFIEAPREVELSRPIQERREPGGRLGALFYSLEGNGDKSSMQPPGGGLQAGAPQSEEAKVASGGAPASDKPRDVTPSSAQPVPSEARVKESVNTEGPVEGPEFKDRVSRGVSGGSAPRRIESPPEELSRREGAPREELQGGPPRAVLPADGPPGFENQRTYRVLEGTSVLSAPSFGGRVIGHLERGDRVLVEGKLGRWLRLRSKKGRGGYVLAVDVEELSEPHEAQ